MVEVQVALADGTFVRLRTSYALRLDDEGRVVLVVGKTEHVTRWTDVARARVSIDGKRDLVEERRQAERDRIEADRLAREGR